MAQVGLGEPAAGRVPFALSGGILIGGLGDPARASGRGVIKTPLIGRFCNARCTVEHNRQSSTENTVALLCWERVCKMERTVSGVCVYTRGQARRQEAGGEMAGRQQRPEGGDAGVFGGGIATSRLL